MNLTIKTQRRLPTIASLFAFIFFQFGHFASAHCHSLRDSLRAAAQKLNGTTVTGLVTIDDLTSGSNQQVILDMTSTANEDGSLTFQKKIRLVPNGPVVDQFSETLRARGRTLVAESRGAAVQGTATICSENRLVFSTATSVAGQFETYDINISSTGGVIALVREHQAFANKKILFYSLH